MVKCFRLGCNKEAIIQINDIDLCYDCKDIYKFSMDNILEDNQIITILNAQNTIIKNMSEDLDVLKTIIIELTTSINLILDKKVLDQK